jgi:hypothetical protein
MPNPPSTTLAAGVPQYILIIVTANNVQPDGSNPGLLDTTTPLTFEGLQGYPSAVVASEDGQTTDGKRIVKLTPATLTIGTSTQPWSFRIKAANRTGLVVASGFTNAPLDVSGTAWDGTPPSTTRPS